VANAAIIMAHGSLAVRIVAFKTAEGLLVGRVAEGAVLLGVRAWVFVQLSRLFRMAPGADGFCLTGP